MMIHYILGMATMMIVWGIVIIRCTIVAKVTPVLPKAMNPTPLEDVWSPIESLVKWAEERAVGEHNRWLDQDGMSEFKVPPPGAGNEIDGYIGIAHNEQRQRLGMETYAEAGKRFKEQAKAGGVMVLNDVVHIERHQDDAPTGMLIRSLMPISARSLSQPYEKYIEGIGLFRARTQELLDQTIYTYMHSEFNRFEKRLREIDRSTSAECREERLKIHKQLQIIVDSLDCVHERYSD